MTLTFTYDQRKFEALSQQLRGMRERSQDVSPAWNALLDWFAEQNQAQWLTRGGRYRQPWAPLATSTVDEKFRQGWPLDPLIRTGELVQSLTHRPLRIEHITGREVRAGTDVPYAKFHQTGTRRMPQRILFSPLQIKREEAATTAVANWIIGGEQRVGGRTVMRGGR
jgi:hypothetical protein